MIHYGRQEVLLILSFSCVSKIFLFILPMKWLAAVCAVKLLSS